MGCFQGGGSLPLLKALAALLMPYFWSLRGAVKLALVRGGLRIAAQLRALSLVKERESPKALPKDTPAMEEVMGGSAEHWIKAALTKGKKHRKSRLWLIGSFLC